MLSPSPDTFILNSSNQSITPTRSFPSKSYTQYSVPCFLFDFSFSQIKIGAECVGMMAKWMVWMVVGLMLRFKGGFAIRFGIDKEECLSHNVYYEGETVHVSFVVIKADSSWHFGEEEGIDLAIKGPNGENIHEFHNKISEKYEFMAQRKGTYRFCFTNKSPYHETIDFDVHVGHYLFYDQHAKDEHFNPMLEMISKLEEALYNIQFEQHWLEAQTDRQALVNEAMSKRAVYKAIFESLALVGASFLQVYLLRRLFERKLGTSRV